MNIFVLDQDPIIAAQYMCDKHVVKMATESAQLLCTAIHKRLEREPDNLISGLYAPTHPYHPSVLWAGENKDNFEWLVEHARAISAEYSFRYKKHHAALNIINKAAVYSPLFDMTGGRTSFVRAMPEICLEGAEYPTDEQAVTAYRIYYRLFKRGFSTWKNREPPPWWTEAENEVKLGRGYIASINKTRNHHTS